jgi:hypothetical protein
MSEKTEEEIWVKIDFLEEKGFGTYFVSSKGQVKNKKGYVLKPITDKYGYYRVPLRNKERKVKQFFVHRLVGMCFIKNELNKPQVNHKDLNKKNNSVNNLEWCNNSENIKHAYSNGILSQKGSKNNCSKLNEEKVIEIYRLKGKLKHQEIAKMYGVSRTTVTQILCQINWKHLTDKIVY